MLSNVGVNITAFVASLGIGGVAVALAVQNILGDLFASLAIAIDKPFEVGDAIGVGAVSGSVEYVGLKTTRIRADRRRADHHVQRRPAQADGEQLQAHGYPAGGLHFRSSAYETTPEQAEAIPGIIRAIIEASDKVRFDRAHFKGFGESALNFEVVYIVLTPDYMLYMDLQQQFNLQLMREVQNIGARFAGPARTIYVELQGEVPAFSAASG